MSSIKDQLNSNIQDLNSLQGLPLRKDSPEYQEQLSTLLQNFINLQNSIINNSIFSTNEGLDDLNTSEIKYLSINYYIATLYNELDDPSKVHNLKKSLIAYLQFLTTLNNYDLLNKRQTEQLDLIKESPFILQELNISAQLRREEKIANYKLEKTLSVQIDKLNKLEEDSKEMNAIDEDTIRGLYLSQIKFFTLQTFNNIHIAQQEIEILSNIPQPKVQEVQEDQENRSDSRTPSMTSELQFTDKVETLPSSALLSKQGKILKPFTILKRADLQSKVFGTGQYLPTMTVEDYLEQELANGGMVSQSQPDEEDEDDYEANDRETYKKREWDNFTETHRKGSGNTMNLG
ncbi:hypothetical protein WICPIJ_006198 [Wickerhamomyces pijperi]|uniref:TAP42-like protein n=1 Tax=Wickerhamomyces pijperi TaxID=599730 RepID=A0A9P8Q4X2_WICPI|nr:hypothetical protein WICPIJ_006198 [Wickerhamomyces pijperi]